jgi:hypothetical protein
MPSDMLWAPRFTSSEYVMRTKGVEEYISKMIESKEFWSIVMVPNFYKNSKLGVVIEMVIKRKHEFIFGAYFEKE